MLCLEVWMLARATRVCATWKSNINTTCNPMVCEIRLCVHHQISFSFGSLYLPTLGNGQHEPNEFEKCYFICYMIYRWITTWRLEQYANWPFVGSTHDVYKSKDILCRSEGIPSFFSKTSPVIFIVAWWLWRPRVSTRNVPCWTKPWRSRGLDGGFSFWPCRMCWLIWWDFSKIVWWFSEWSTWKNWESYFGALCKVSNICWQEAQVVCHLERNETRKLSTAVTGIVH